MLVGQAGESHFVQLAVIRDAAHQDRPRCLADLFGCQTEVRGVVQEPIAVQMAAVALVECAQRHRAAVAAQHLAALVHHRRALVGGDRMAKALRFKVGNDLRNLLRAGHAAAIAGLQGRVIAQIVAGV